MLKITITPEACEIFARLLGQELEDNPDAVFRITTAKTGGG